VHILNLGLNPANPVQNKKPDHLSPGNPAVFIQDPWLSVPDYSGFGFIKRLIQAPNRTTPSCQEQGIYILRCFFIRNGNKKNAELYPL